MRLTHPRLFALSCALLLALSGAASADLVDRWTSTATDPSLSRGDAATVTWGIITEGSDISNDGTTESSNLIARLDEIYDETGGGSDLTDRAWYSVMESAMNRWGEVSGLTFLYEPNDDGAAIDGSATPRGELGVRADVRIGGRRIDGNSGVLAYAYYPTHGDMVIDTDDNYYNNTNNNSVRLFNVVAHEIGHSIGLNHVESNNAGFLMEPFINTSFRGPQFDDILNAQRGYGDVFEKNGGNDSFSTATNLGVLVRDGSIVIGNDADSTSVGINEVDFISIDGLTDVDFLSFTLTEEGILDLILDPMGPTYNRGPQNGSQSPFDASAQSNLILELLDIDGETLLGYANDGGLGESESLEGFVLGPGTYYARISATDEDATQMYRLSANFSAVPEPGQVLIFGGLAIAGLCYRIRRKRNQLS